MTEVRWERMFPDQLEQAFSKCPLVYLTYGLCEPHGPHNTLGLDALKAHGIACKAAQAGGGIVAPPDYWHIHELGGYAQWAQRAVGEVERKWLTAVPPWIHFKNICYQIRSAEVIGFHAVILLTGHYGPNWQDLKRLVELIQPYTRARLYSLPDLEANQPGFDRDGISTGDHAGKVETSLLWSLEPTCVDMSRLPDREEAGPHFAMGEDAHESDRRTGDRMVADEVNWLLRKARELLREFKDEPLDGSLETFEDVEVFWQEQVLPAIGGFETMKTTWDEKVETVPSDSVWFANSQVPQMPSRESTDPKVGGPASFGA